MAYVDLTFDLIPIPNKAPQVSRARRFGNKRVGGVFLRKHEDIACYQEAITVLAKAQYSGQILDGPIEAHVAFYLPRPKSVPKSRVLPSRKPDLDNLEKPLWDSLQGVVISNDSRICDKYMKKRYAASPDEARIEIHLNELDPDDENLRD